MSGAYRFSVSIMPRDGILDPAGRAVENALPELHADNVHAVRVGRRVELTVEADSSDRARATVDSLAADFLANPLVESWAIEEMPR
ncbi:MAG TPA: phosphoribosylformylglycinamidine synthase subunit PurS [Candidatus Limnocylindria bacterium]|nr:phosphoribosylformylglycinamidine synthase subunit PurS [Candidatus Limnocylindria bacterium]